MDATADPGLGDLNDVVEVFASMDCPATVHSGFQYLLGYNWVSCCRILDFDYFQLLYSPEVSIRA
jgi:Kip1 ubiquitination-promoting complex protein 1